jgi:acetyl/propionyl-CoA carboxylase alpha subunit/acetyl-CoA carboxylase carboxyltransferase component
MGETLGRAGSGAQMIRRVLIANRGEIAIRIARTCLDLDMVPIMVHGRNEADAPHTHAGTQAVALAGTGVAAYLDQQDLIRAARSAGCDAVHPGYGFLSESPAFAQSVIDAGLIFIGPAPQVLAELGHKAQARQRASALGIPILNGTPGGIDLVQAQEFLNLLNGQPVMIKAVAGGGGRGMRVVRDATGLERVFNQCAAEAKAAFGDGALYLEQFMAQARHIEIQIAGDHTGHVVHFWERDCSLQRRHQKIIEIAPAPYLPASLRRRLCEAACAIAQSVTYQTIGTVEFLVDVARDEFVYLEVNPRLQVEHTITEQVLGLDLVALQFALASGSTLSDLGMTQAAIPHPNGYAIQARISAESLAADGTFRAGAGVIFSLDLPGGPGIRIDSDLCVGRVVDPGFDPLLAKLIVHSLGNDFPRAWRRFARSLGEFHLTGLANNQRFLRALAQQDALLSYQVDTGFVERIMPDLALSAAANQTVLTGAPSPSIPNGLEAVYAPMAGRVVGIDVEIGAAVSAGQACVILDAMKMEHLVSAPLNGRVVDIRVTSGAIAQEGQVLILIEPDLTRNDDPATQSGIDLDLVRADLQAYFTRRELTLDAARPGAVDKRHARGMRSARENLADLFDPDSFIEYGGFAIAAQRRRRTLDDLIANTPADGLVGGIGTVNADLVGEEAARCMGLAYDFTVLAGTQGFQNHRKQDRLFALAEQWHIPAILFAEGGGGRPGDVDAPSVAGLGVPTFAQWAKLSGLVPRLGIAAGRCFAGNAALLGCADTIIATRDANIGMGGPAMIEGGGLGQFAPEDIGPAPVLYEAGAVDILADDEPHAVTLAKQYLSFFQGPIKAFDCDDQRKLRHVIPENRLRAYDIRQVMTTLCDSGSVLELRQAYGIGIITALVRIDGRPFGLIANNPVHLGGAIDAEAAEKAGRFMQLCDGFDLPMISLCDTPGFMVGPDIEAQAQMRRVSRMFVTAASMSVPTFTIVLRKGYGLGAQAMAAGGFQQPFFIVSWPTGEFGGMGLEGAVRLGYRKELDAETDPEKRQALYEKLVAKLYDGGKALSMASHFEIDAVIDPMETRAWITRGVKSVPQAVRRSNKKRPMVDTW